MSIRWDSRNKRWRFEFDRVIQGRRQRLSRLLPQGWNQAQADAYDRKEGARLYAVASGVERVDPLISDAILLYLSDKTDLKSLRSTTEHLAAIDWAIHGRRLSELPQVAIDVRDQSTGLSPGTIRNRLACLKAACRWAWKRHGLTEHDPTARMQLPAVRNERHVYLQREEMLALAYWTPDRDLRRLIRCAFYTGLRLGELQRVEVRGGLLYLADTKNGDMRAIPVHPRIRSALRHLPLREKDRYYQHAFKRVRDLLGWGHVHIHDLRHSAASEMANADVDLYTIGQVLGHRDARSTQRYSHLTAHKLADAVGKIGRKSPHKPAAAGEKKAA